MKSKPELPNISLEAHNMSSIDSYIQAVEGFEENASTQLSEVLENFLKHVAKTGDILAPWEKVQIIFIHKIKEVLDDFFKTNPYKEGKVNSNCENDKFEEIKDRICKLAAEFESPPFTFQRLCELVTNPKKNYTKCEKFARAMEKNLMVVSPWSYSSRRSNDNSEQVNGGFDLRPMFTSADRPWSQLPPSPVTTTAPALPDVANTVEASALGKEVTDKKAEDKPEAEVNIEKAPEQSDQEETMETETIPDKETDNDSKSDKSSEASKEGASALPVALAEPASVISPETTGHFVETSSEKLEPLPGVGTLVEKYNSARTATSVEEPHSVEESVTETTENVETSQSANQSDDITAAKSPKRKLSTEEFVQMDVGSPTKRPKLENETESEQSDPNP